MKTLIVIDVQNDFMPGGTLEVPGGDKIVPVINGILPRFDLVVATQDWHPRQHVSFAVNHEDKKPFEKIKTKGVHQTLWPDHCIQDTSGAEFHPLLQTHYFEAIIRKGLNPEIDSYSAFYDNAHLKSTGLTGYLKEKNAELLYFCGLAGDVCVYHSIKDALKEGFECVLIEDATRALDIDSFNDTIKEKLKKSGVRFINSWEL